MATFNGREEILVAELRRKFRVSDEEYQQLMNSSEPSAAVSLPSYGSPCPKTTLGSSETPANHNIELQEHSEPHVATIQAEAIPFIEGKQTYLVNAEDVHVHPDHIPLTSSTNSHIR